MATYSSSAYSNPSFGGVKRPTGFQAMAGPYGTYRAAPSPSPSQPTTLPPDPLVVAAQTSAGRNTAIGDAYGEYEKTNINTDYGLDPAYANNPFSRAKLLAESYERNQRGSLNSYAAQGQLYSGAYQRAQDEDTRNYNIGYYNLTRDFNRALEGVDWRTLQNYAANSLGVDDATFNALLNKLGGK